jgi:hypothetical protein
MNPFDFRVSINNNLFRARMIRVSKVVIPKPPNITKFNNVLSFRQYDGFIDQTFSIILQPAFYNTTTLSNALASAMTTAAGGANVYVVAYDPITRSFAISHTTLGVPQPFYLINTSSFIQRGEFLAHFNSLPDLLSALAVGLPTQLSSIAGMLYTRYALISSESLNQYSFSDSRSTTLLLRNNIICMVDMTSIYNPEDYDVGVPFSGVFATVVTRDAPHIMVTNPQRNLNDRIDIHVQDEYGETFQDLMDLNYAGSPNVYPTNTLGVSLWMEVSF